MNAADCKLNAATDIIFIRTDGPGWWPIQHLANLAATSLDANLYLIDRLRGGKAYEALSRLYRNSASSGRTGIIIAKPPRDLRLALGNLALLRSYSRLVAWIVDGVYSDWLPSDRFMDQFDLIAHMSCVDIDYYHRQFGNRAKFIGFGADALRITGLGDNRDIDLLRIGRQPDTWDDDAETSRQCDAAGVEFQGRPPFFDTPEDQLQGLAAYYQRSKFTIAHTTLVSRHGATHPTKEYITARWTDALANGTTIVGIHPKSDPSMEMLLWPEATVELEGIELASNIAEIQDLCQQWTPATARNNHRLALERLDWRWRRSLTSKHQTWNAN